MAVGGLPPAVRRTRDRFASLERRIALLNASPSDRDTLAPLVALVREAGAVALDFFEPGGKTRAGVKWKGDGSPVTEADYAVNRFLEPRLKALWPDAAWLSEESADDEARLRAERVIIVDPIDGTRGFSRGDRHWCIAVALVVAGRPAVAVVHAPALEQTFTAVAGGGAFLNGVPLHVAEGDAAEGAATRDLQITCPEGLSKAMRAAGIHYDFRPKIASLALRVAMVASGVYDAGFTTRDSHDWDLAAADLVLQEAGGLLADLDGAPLIYNKREPSHGALTATPRRLHSRFREDLARTPYG